MSAHLCYWPTCPRPVPPKMWGCAPHWFRLPKPIRDAIWAAYVPGQETTKTPSAAYLTAAMAAHEFALNENAKAEPGPVVRLS